MINVRNKKFFAKFSLFSFVISVIVHLWPLNAIPPIGLLWPIHIMVLIAGGSMVIFLVRERRTIKLSVENVGNSIKAIFRLLKKHSYLFLFNLVSVVLLLFLYQYVANDFMSEAASAELDNPVRVFSGGWMFFSFMTTVYYYIYDPLEKKYRKLIAINTLNQT